MVSEILQESLRIHKEYIKEYIKNETQTVEKRPTCASLLLYLETHVKRVVVC